jgi:hypothetical protein
VVQLIPGLSDSKFAKVEPHSVAKDWHVSPATAAEEKLQDTVLPFLGGGGVGEDGVSVVGGVCGSWGGGMEEIGG